MSRVYNFIESVMRFWNLDPLDQPHLAIRIFISKMQEFYQIRGKIFFKENILHNSKIVIFSQYTKASTITCIFRTRNT